MASKLPAAADNLISQHYTVQCTVHYAKIVESVANPDRGRIWTFWAESGPLDRIRTFWTEFGPLDRIRTFWKKSGPFRQDPDKTDQLQISSST